MRSIDDIFVIQMPAYRQNKHIHQTCNDNKYIDQKGLTLSPGILIYSVSFVGGEWVAVFESQKMALTDWGENFFFFFFFFFCCA